MRPQFSTWVLGGVSSSLPDGFVTGSVRAAGLRFVVRARPLHALLAPQRSSLRAVCRSTVGAALCRPIGCEPSTDYRRTSLEHRAGALQDARASALR